MRAPTPLIAEMSLGLAWDACVRRHPARTALIFEEQCWTTRALGLAAGTAADTLSECGVAGGDRVMLMMDNGPGFLAAFLACQLLGAVAVPVSPKSTVERVAHLSEDCAARVIVVDSVMNPRTRALHAAQPYGARMLDFAPQASGELRAPQAQAGSGCAFIQYTSGSTGKAKGVMVSHAAALANIASFCHSMQLGQDEVFCSLLPLFHDMGLVCFGLAPLLLGHPLVLHRQESLSLYRWLESIGHYRATLTGAPDSLLQIANRVVEDPSVYALHSLRMLICGSEPVRRETLERFGTRFGLSHALKPAYGMAELTLCATLTPPDTPYRVSARGDVASGKPIGGVQVAIRDQAGRIVGTHGVVGEILVRSPSRMSGYWNQPAATDATLDAQGWIATGDIGYLDEAGYLYVVGREKNLLIRGGEKFNPHDLESAALSQPEVRRAGIVQLQSGHCAIVAVLEVDRGMLRDTAALRELETRFRQAAHQRAGIAPDRCGFVPGGHIPMTENGKMQHGALRQLIESGALQAGWTDLPLEHEHAAALA